MSEYRDLLKIAEEVLKETSLCDRCFGRLFAKLGHGWNNKVRGEALKRVVLMRVHERLRRGDASAENDLRKIAPNVGEIAKGVYLQVFGEELKTSECVICGSIIEEFLERVSKDVASVVKAHNAPSFLIGVICDKNVLKREEEITSKYGIDFWESIKREIKREIGKRVQQMTSAVPDFKHPALTLIVKFPEGSLEIAPSSMLIKGRYWKTGRMISQAFWPTVNGPKYFSIEEAASGVLALTRGDSVVVHASGREDVDVRVLGSGRPLIIEIKAPSVWVEDLEAIEKALNSTATEVVKFKVEGFAESKNVIRVYKEELAIKGKTYRALIYVEGGVREEDMRTLEERFANRTILQRTPKRVLKRKKDMVRTKLVESVKCKILTSNLIECLIRASGGLYVKELVSGDDGRTTPSFSEALGRRAFCIELDVLEVSVNPKPLEAQGLAEKP
ncbi:MAG: tRNA pseudouridine(54/55) synthase Pus10 [Acidilobaceae archaeon]